MSGLKKGYIALALAMLLVGANIPLGKLIIGDVSIVWFSALRFSSAALVIWLICKHSNVSIKGISKKTFLVILCQAICGSCLFTFFMLYGLTKTSAGNAGLITSTTPVFIALGAWLFLKELLTRPQIQAILLACSALAIVSLSGNPTTQSMPHLTGDLFILFAVCAEAAFALLSRANSVNTSPIVIIFYNNLFSAFIYLPMLLWEPSGWTALNMENLSLIALYTLSASLICYYLWFYGIARVPVSRAGIFTALMPFGTLIVSVPLLGETITIQHVFAIVLVLLSIYLVSSGSKKAIPQPNKPEENYDNVTKR